MMLLLPPQELCRDLQLLAARGNVKAAEKRLAAQYGTAGGAGGSSGDQWVGVNEGTPRGTVVEATAIINSFGICSPVIW